MHTLNRQMAHWLHAAERLLQTEKMASDNAWQGLEKNTAALIKAYLHKNVSQLVAKGYQLQRQVNNAASQQLKAQLRRALLRYKADYTKIETTIHFYTDAINTRTWPDVAAMLKGCDVLGRQCMEIFLRPLHKPVPPVITYLDRGLGAAIMKAGLRLWDGSTSPAALIKITYHNLYRPTAVLHECGHQVAHLLGWNRELAETMYNGVKDKSTAAAKVFAGWSSEIAADAIALVCTGFAAVAALHDVVDGEGEAVFMYSEADPHPIAFIRVLLNCAMCRHLFGHGPWQQMEEQWLANHPLTEAGDEAAGLIEKLMPLLPAVAAAILQTKQAAFGNKPITALADVQKVSPQQLLKQDGQLQASPFFKAEKMGLQYVALSGYKIGTGLGNIGGELNKMQAFLINTGQSSIPQYSFN
jgi:hypothetical protein